MSALPVNPGQQPAMFGGSPLQASLAMLFGGLSAAGQPGGWGNFGQGVQSAGQNWQSMQANQQRFQIMQQESQRAQERFDDDQRRANKAEADAQARRDLIGRILRGGAPQPASIATASAPGAQPMPGPMRPDMPPRMKSAMLGGDGVSPGIPGMGTGSQHGGAPRLESSIGSIGPGGGSGPPEVIYDSTQQAGVPAMFGGLGFTPQQSALFSQYAELNPDEAFQMLMQRSFAEPDEYEPNSPLGKLKADLDAGLIDRPTYDALVRKETAGPQGPGLTERQRNALAAGLKEGTPEYQQYILGRDDNEGGGPFEGNAMDAQASNILLTGDPMKPEYAAAYAHLAQPKVQFDPTTNRLVTVQPDLSWATKPGQQRAEGAGAASPPAFPLPLIGNDRPGPTVQNAQAMPQQQPALSQPLAQSIEGAETMQVPGATITSSPGTGLSAADRSKLRNVKAEAQSIRETLNRLRDVVKETGFGARASALGGGMTEGGRRLNAAWTNAALASKAEALFNLGVLNGPDLSVIQGTLPNPSTATGAMTTDEAYGAAIDEVLRLIDSRVAAFESQYGGGSAQPAPSGPTLPGGGTRVDQLPDGNWE